MLAIQSDSIIIGSDDCCIVQWSTVKCPPPPGDTFLARLDSGGRHLQNTSCPSATSPQGTLREGDTFFGYRGGIVGNVSSS